MLGVSKSPWYEKNSLKYKHYVNFAANNYLEIQIFFEESNIYIRHYKLLFEVEFFLLYLSYISNRVFIEN